MSILTPEVDDLTRTTIFTEGLKKDIRRAVKLSQVERLQSAIRIARSALQWDVCIMAAHSNPRLLRGKSVAGRSERCRFPVFGKERTVSFALALGRFFSSKGCQIERVIFSSTWIKG